MKEIPVCLQRHYQALDNLINNLNALSVKSTTAKECYCGCNTDRSIKLMCDFWNILKEDPNCDLTEVVKRKMDLNKGESKSNVHWHPPGTSCYMASHCSHKAGESSSSGQKKSYCHRGGDIKSTSSGAPSVAASCSGGSDNFPLSTVFCNLKEATSFENNCSAKLNDLLHTEEQLKEAIKKLEQREKKGTELLQQADCMWVCMEDAYKKKLSESTERQKELEKELKELELSTKKWRKNMKDLESELGVMDKTHQEIKEKIIERNSDVKCIDLEIIDLQKRLENNKKAVEATKKSAVKKKEASDKKIASLAVEVKELEKTVAEENKRKRDKELEGTKFIKEAREDLQKICGVLLKKKLENEDLKAEKATLLSEIEMITEESDKCNSKCETKQKSLEGDIEKLNREIVECELKCIRCNECTDTSELQSFCIDCPKCLEQKRCSIKGDHCGPDASMDCVCTAVKKKFLDNVFENMYTVLERLINKGSGKAVADKVVECLKRSQNGKLDEKTRKALQTFILTGVKKHLNLTIVGGAVKTRCEMEPEMYKQLMNCLQKVQVKTPKKVDKGTVSKKQPCRRWGGTNECNCPRGPKDCICIRKAPPPPHDPTSCPEDDEDNPEEDNANSCPLRDSVNCDCEKPTAPRVTVDRELSELRPEPCKGSKCKFSKNMRTAPCVIRSDESAATRNRDRRSRPLKTGFNPPSCSKDQDFCDCAVAGGFSRSDTGTKILNLNSNIINLAKSPSGALVLEFKRDFIESIKKEMKLNPSAKVVVKVAEFGRLLLEFLSDENDFDLDRTMKLKNVLSGCLFFEGNGNILELINKSIHDLAADNKNLRDQCDNIKPNAVLRETPSGIVLIIATESLQLIRKKLSSFTDRVSRVPDKYSRVKILHLDNTVIDFPGVLKSTPSQNYVLAVDKEFEKSFRETVRNIIVDNSAVIASLGKSNSDCCLVKFRQNDADDESVMDIGVLKKTRSGNIKILVNDPCSADLMMKWKCEPTGKKFAQHCIDLLKKIDISNTYHILVHQKPYIAPRNVSNHQISKEIASARQIQQFGLPPWIENIVSKTSYVPLHEKSRFSFIAKLKKMLLDPSKSRRFRQTMSDSSIFLIHRGPCKNPILMEITSSKNIYLLPNKQRGRENSLIQCSLTNLIDDTTEKNHCMNNKLIASSNDSNSHDGILPVLEAISKASQISCNVTEQIQSEVKADSECYGESTIICSATESGETMQYIVIKPTSKLSCVYHSDQCNVSSSDDLPRSNVNNQTQRVTIKTGDDNSGWDSLSFLPPQLPSFLGDVIQLYN